MSLVSFLKSTIRIIGVRNKKNVLNVRSRRKVILDTFYGKTKREKRFGENGVPVKKNNFYFLRDIYLFVNIFTKRYFKIRTCRCC